MPKVNVAQASESKKAKQAVAISKVAVTVC